MIVSETVSRRRTLFAAAGSVIISSGITAGAAASIADLAEEPDAQPTATAGSLSPIMAAATRLSQLSALDEKEMTDEQMDAVTREQIDLQYLITDTAPRSVADTVVLLMVAVAEIGRKALNDDGSFTHEHGEVIVRRVMHFLGDRERLDLDSIGGAFLLPWEGQETLALSGTVAEAALRFNKVDKARAWNRHDEDRAMTERQLIRARHGLTSPFEGKSA